jgi:uncharacterized repeat protein (TIGR03803 family)
MRLLKVLGITLAVATGMLVTAGAAIAQSSLNVLHAFAPLGPVNPAASLIQATDGNFYGTTAGDDTSNAGGTVFKMTPAGTVTVLHNFVAGTTDGARPKAALIQATDGNFYGTTVLIAGTVFKLTPSGTLTLLHAFNYPTEGESPYAALIQATDGTFYGTTYSGGASDAGTVFRMTKIGGTVIVLHTFTGGADGAHPAASLIRAADGNFYGTTNEGGGGACVGGCGTIFQMTPSGTVTILHAFNDGADGAYPVASLIQATDGDFYGTTSGGGGFDCGGLIVPDPPTCGTIFRMTSSGTVTVLHAFARGADGRFRRPP